MLESTLCFSLPSYFVLKLLLFIEKLTKYCAYIARDWIQTAIANNLNLIFKLNFES